LAGITPQGFSGKSREDIILEIETLAKSPELFSHDVDLTPYSPLGIFIALVAESIALQWEAFEAIYYAGFLDTAEGVDLDRIARFAGVTRKPPQKEQIELSFTGTDGTIIPNGFIVQTTSGIQFQTIESKIISGITSVTAEALEYGVSSRVGIGQLTEFATPQAGIDSVGNLFASTGGASLESDADFRARAIDNINVFRKNVGLIDYIKRQIKNDPNVISCEIVENQSNIEVNSMPPHSMQFVIDGGSSPYIASLIRKFKPAGIQLVGSILELVSNNNGGYDSIYFSRPGDYDIVVKLSILANAQWQNSNLRKIKTEIIQYVGGIDSYTENGNDFVNEYKGLGVGKKVSVFNIYPLVADFVGIDNLNISLGTTLYNAVNNVITPPSGMRAKLITANVVVEVT